MLKKKPPNGLTPIASYARIKPMVGNHGGASSSKHISSFDEENGSVTISGIDTRGGGRVFNHLTKVISPDVSQSYVYEQVATPLVGSFINGYDVDMISYGQTGAGKTFTMFGPFYG